MSTTNCMYKLKPVINRSELVLQSTSSMYKLKNIQCNGVESASVQTNDLTIGTKGEQHVQSIQEQSADEKMVKEIEERQGGILKQLQNLQQRLQVIQTKINDVEQLPEENVTNQTVAPNLQVTQLVETMAIENINGLVIKVNSKIAPISLLLLRQLWEDDVAMNVKIYHLSSASSLSNYALNVAERLQAPQKGNTTTQVNIELIWKDIASGCVEFTPPNVAGGAPITPLTGEVNLLRYLSRVGPAKFNYERMRDSLMYYEKMFDHVHRFIYADTKTEQVNILRVLSGHLGKKQWFGAENTFDVLDIACYSAIIRANYRNELPNAAMTKWLSSVEKRFNVDALLKN